jgi:hypothetical protein
MGRLRGCQYGIRNELDAIARSRDGSGGMAGEAAAVQPPAKSSEAARNRTTPDPEGPASGRCVVSPVGWPDRLPW